jgi:membrane protein implicated in regulation of membrane protease activity
MFANTTVLLWLIAGVVLCILEFTVPTAFVEFIMGISAIIVAFVAMVEPRFSIQVAIWLFLSAVMIIASRRFVPVDQPSMVKNAEIAKTLTEIPPDEVGRILYEGCSWQAKCGNPNEAIAPGVKVHIVGREGNTLLVVPEEEFKRDREGE